MSCGGPRTASSRPTSGLNPEGALALRKEAGRGFFRGRANVGYWWWEVLGALPGRWRRAFGLLDEVFVGRATCEKQLR